MQNQQTIIQPAQFEAVRNVYSTKDNVYCYITFPTVISCIPETGDWVGIYKVGWTGLNDYICKKMIREADMWGQQAEQFVQVNFDAEVLPKNTEQYYQFVYVNNAGVMRGVSKCFIFEAKHAGHQEQEIFDIMSKIKRTELLTKKDTLLKQLMFNLREKFDMEDEIRQVVLPTGIRQQNGIEQTYQPTLTIQQQHIKQLIKQQKRLLTEQKEKLTQITEQEEQQTRQWLQTQGPHAQQQQIQAHAQQQRWIRKEQQQLQEMLEQLQEQLEQQHQQLFLQVQLVQGQQYPVVQQGQQQFQQIQLLKQQIKQTQKLQRTIQQNQHELEEKLQQQTTQMFFGVGQVVVGGPQQVQQVQYYLQKQYKQMQQIHQGLKFVQQQLEDKIDETLFTVQPQYECVDNTLVGKHGIFSGLGFDFEGHQQIQRRQQRIQKRLLESLNMQQQLNLIPFVQQPFLGQQYQQLEQQLNQQLPTRPVSTMVIMTTPCENNITTPTTTFGGQYLNQQYVTPRQVQQWCPTMYTTTPVATLRNQVNGHFSF